LKGNFLSRQIHQNTTFVFIVFVNVSATAAAFVETTVYQDGPMDQENDTYQERTKKSMNRDDGYYQLPHIYTVSKKTSPTFLTVT